MTERPETLHRGAAPASPAFTLLELIVVIAIVALLMAILVPGLSHARAAMRTTACASNTRQMSMALQMYRDESDGWIFPLRKSLAASGTLWWFGFEAAGGPKAEGSRILDRTRGRLWPYYQASDSIEICPAFALDSGHYKPKYTTNWTTYGHPLSLMNPAAPVRTGDIERPGDTVAFADSAQINFFQAPASPNHPMFEQWYYISRLERTVHYVHGGRANASMYDGHVRMLDPQFGVSSLFPEAPVGRPPSDVVIGVP